jgi:hypothetical protein
MPRIPRERRVRGRRGGDVTFRGNGSSLALKRDREDGHPRPSEVLFKEGIEAVRYVLRYASSPGCNVSDPSGRG